MIAVQDSFGAIIIPYGINLGGNFFDVLNELSIVYIPFLIIYLHVFLEAHAQGADEGRSGPLIIKNLEVKVYSAFLVLMLAVIPMGGKNEVSTKAYACGYSQENTAMADIYRGRPKLSDDKLANAIEHNEFPVLLGLINNITVGASEAMSSQLECNKSHSAIESEMNKQFITVDDEILISNIKRFANQCFQNGLERIAAATSRGSTKIAHPYDEERNTFFGTNLSLAYQGQHSSPATSGLFMSVPDHQYSSAIRPEYKPYNYVSGLSDNYNYATQGTTNTLNVPCHDAAQDLRLDIIANVERNYDEQIDLMHKSASVLPKLKDGVQHYVTHQEVLDKFVHQAFVDSFSGKRTIYQQTPATAEKENQNMFENAWDYAVELVNSVKDPGRAASNVMVNVGFSLENPFKSSEAVNLYGVLPLFISLIIAVVYMASPVLLVLSGYNWNMAFNIAFLLFYLAMMHYWLNVSYLMTNILMMVADSFYGGATWLKNANMALHYSAYFAPFITIIAWTGACTIAGLKLGSLIQGLFTGAGIAASKAGQSVMKQAGNKVSGGKSSVGGGGNRSQFT
jgi:uncharacterized membrane protein YgcG